MAPAASAKSYPNLKPFKPGVSGNPSGPRFVSKRFLELREQITTDLDQAHLTGIERSVIDLAARLLAKAERSSNIDASVRAANAASRLLSRISRHAKPAVGPTLAAYLKSLPPEHDEVAE